MNIDDLKPQGTTDNMQAPSAAPASAPVAPVSAPVQPSMPAQPSAPVAPVTPAPQPVENQMSPFSTPQPAPIQEETPSTVVNFTPVDQVVPSQSETIIAPPPSADKVEVPPVPAADPNLPPLPEPSAIPVNNQEVTVVNTAKKRSGSNIILVVLALLLVLFVWKIDEVMQYVNDNFINKNPGSTGEVTNNNLVEGFIKIEDNTSDYTIKDIRFYNFKKQTNGKLLFNYLSTKNYNKVEELEIFIEIYNSNKELLTKKQFIVDSIESNSVGSDILDLGEEISSYAYYAKVVIYTDEEKTSTTSITCTYNDSNENYLLEYKNEYTFVNNELTGYEVTKKIEAINNNKATANALNAIKKENDDVTKFEIPTQFSETTLVYKIDLNSVNEGYIPYYSKGTTPTMIKMNETGKKWICE